MIENKQPPEPAVEEVGLDQTSFASQEPIYQDVTMPELPGSKKVVDEKKKPPKFIVLVLAGVGALVTILLLLLLLMPRSPMSIVNSDATPTPSPQTQLTEQQQRLQELTDELKAADPKKLDLPFPPIMIKIGLSEDRQ